MSHWPQKSQKFPNFRTPEHVTDSFVPLVVVPTMTVPSQTEEGWNSSSAMRVSLEGSSFFPGLWWGCCDRNHTLGLVRTWSMNRNCSSLSVKVHISLFQFQRCGHYFDKSAKYRKRGWGWALRCALFLARVDFESSPQGTETCFMAPTAF